MRVGNVEIVGMEGERSVRYPVLQIYQVEGSDVLDQRSENEKCSVDGQQGNNAGE